LLKTQPINNLIESSNGEKKIMIARVLIAAAVASVTFASAALAGNVSTIVQSGGTNAAFSAQRGFSNVSTSVQTGRRNASVAVQAGRHNDAAIGQTGRFNAGAVFQTMP
jgi:hypothetical protein